MELTNYINYAMKSILKTPIAKVYIIFNFGTATTN